MHMRQPIKIAVIGGGSTYTPELIEGLLASAVPVREVALVDPDLWKLEIVGGLAQRMTVATGNPFAVTLTHERSAALDGADIVVTQFRVGGMAARILDERIPQQFGLIGQETTGPGGFAKALRTIPVILDINREMALRCPDAWMINFTNPSGLITEALRRHGQGKFVGLCNYPLTLKMNAARALQVAEERLELAYFGLNHLSWARVLVDSADRTEELLALMPTTPEGRTLSGYPFTPELLARLGLIPSGYLRYYYETAAQVEAQRTAPQTRGEFVRAVEEQLLVCYADQRLCRKPAELQQRGGAWYSTAAVRLIADLYDPRGATHVLNVPNGGALPFLPPEVIVEVPARVNDDRIAGLPVIATVGDAFSLAGHPIPAEVIALTQRVKAYELAAVHAAVTGAREDAITALALHPLLDGRHDAIPDVIDALFTAHQAYLPCGASAG